MVNWAVSRRHWTPVQGYATGDTLISLCREYWKVVSARRVDSEGPAILWDMELCRGSEALSLIVLDGPAARESAESAPREYARQVA